MIAYYCGTVLLRKKRRNIECDRFVKKKKTYSSVNIALWRKGFLPLVSCPGDECQRNIQTKTASPLHRSTSSPSRRLLGQRKPPYLPTSLLLPQSTVLEDGPQIQLLVAQLLGAPAEPETDSGTSLPRRTRLRCSLSVPAATDLNPPTSLLAFSFPIWSL